jgi:pimeloyl-ACP methyl ester carboxylesterase
MHAVADAGVRAADAVYIGTPPDQIFGWYHPGHGFGPNRAVVLVPPWGWDEIASYRGRRTWAQRLAEAGIGALRIDLPGCGDSAGSPDDVGLVDAWTSAVVTASDWLRVASGASRIGVIGLGLGGLVAARAISKGAAVDDLVLWATPANGRAFLRQVSAFSRMQSSRYALGAPLPSTLPDGWIEAGGFVLSPSSIDEISRVDAGRLTYPGVTRALLLDRDGIAPDPALLQAIRSSGADVTVSAGPGWESLCLHPQSHRPPLKVIEQVSTWLAQPTDKPPVMAERVESAGAPATTVMQMRVDGVDVIEMPIGVDVEVGRLFGIVARPSEPHPSVLSVVFLNAGAVRRVGPNRMWVEAARRWAARGITTLRIDVESLGDADGDADRIQEVGELYVPAIGDQLVAVLDAMQEQGLTGPFVLVGLCAGGYWSFQTALRDDRVIATVLLNPGALIWDPTLIEARAAQALGTLRRRSAWRKLRRGVRIGRIRQVVAASARVASTSALRRLSCGRLAAGAGTGRSGEPLDDKFARLQARSVRTLLAFSDDEPLFDELAASGILSRLPQWPVIELARLPAADHTVRPIVAQRAAHALIDAELERAVGQVDRSPARVGDDPFG